MTESPVDPSREAPKLTRRRLLSGAGLAACFVALGRSRKVAAGGRWGPPLPDPHGILDLPEGFRYDILEIAGQTMSDGYRVPGKPDGMACFIGPDTTLILMRNHEISLNAFAEGPYPKRQRPPDEAYDPAGMGGVSRVVLDARSFERLSSNMVLMGTSRNCAGGPSPWGWLSCEETTAINGTHRHGYVFACRIDADTVQPPDRKPGFGRFFHEAAAVDPATNITYLTEDRADGCLYRFMPDDIADPFVGRLQALAVVDRPNLVTGRLKAGSTLDIAWVDIDEPDPDTDSVRFQAQAKGAAQIARGEGMWFHDGQVFFSATIGGRLHKGQLFRLIDGEQPTLEVLFASDDPEVLDMPDNITVAPWGELFVVEDGPGTNAIRWLGADGQLCLFGHTELAEITGICFAPDARAMFLNIQHAGLTLVVTGPFTDDGGDFSGDGGGEPPGLGGEPESADNPEFGDSGCACVTVER